MLTLLPMKGMHKWVSSHSHIYDTLDHLLLNHDEMSIILRDCHIGSWVV